MTQYCGGKTMRCRTILIVDWCKIVLLAVLACMLANLAAQADSPPSPQDEPGLYLAARRDGKLVWYSTNGMAESKAVAAAFTAKYPGVDVDIIRLVGPQQYQRFVAESDAKQYIADVVNISDKPLLESLIEGGQLSRWRIPTIDRLPDQYHLQDYVYAFQKTVLALIYNENKVTPQEASLLAASWANILDPRFKGRFAIAPQKCGQCYAGVHMFLDPKMAETFPPDFMQKVADQHPAIYTDMFGAIDRVVAGEADFTYWSWEGGAATKLAQGAPIRWVYPKPTPAFPNNWFAIASTAPHPAAARLFLNWLGSDAGVGVLETQFGAEPAMHGVADSRSFRNLPWWRPPVEEYTVDFDRWEKNYNTDLDRWIKILANSNR
jgi:ABC-type Fe3+ transport system substrate-binding protein